MLLLLTCGSNQRMWRCIMITNTRVQVLAQQFIQFSNRELNRRRLMLEILSLVSRVIGYWTVASHIPVSALFNIQYDTSYAHILSNCVPLSHTLGPLLFAKWRKLKKLNARYIFIHIYVPHMLLQMLWHISFCVCV